MAHRGAPSVLQVVHEVLGAHEALLVSWVVVQPSTRPTGSAPLDKKLPLGIATKHTAAPIARREGQSSDDREAIAMECRVCLVKLPQHAPLVVLLIAPVLAEVDRIKGHNGLAQDGMAVGMFHGGGVVCRAGEAQGLAAVSRCAAERLGADDHEGLCGLHGSGEEVAGDEALRLDGKQNLFLHRTISQRPATDVGIGKVAPDALRVEDGRILPIHQVHVHQRGCRPRPLLKPRRRAMQGSEDDHTLCLGGVALLDCPRHGVQVVDEALQLGLARRCVVVEGAVEVEAARVAVLVQTEESRTDEDEALAGSHVCLRAAV
mmetsp:Transcript_29407/g.85088  ORF Transcript_29407/g.85088 Transcript_29407/m.85088 type:complete len:318 (-) Transcript_29407:899-1852(-)